MACTRVLTSQTPMELHRITWNIGNFAKIRGSKEALQKQCSRFQMGSSIGLPTDWKCILSCNEVDGRTFIGVFVAVEEPSLGNITELNVTVGVKIDDGRYFNGRPEIAGMKDVLQQPTWDWGFTNVIPLADSANRPLPLNPDGSLSIEIEITLFNLEATSDLSLSTLKSIFEPKFSQKLHSDLEAMYKSPGKPDAPGTITLVSSDAKEFIVNRAILAARSPVFKVMFEAPMKEAQQGVVQINDISGLALDALLHFIVAGTLSENWTEVEIITQFTYGAHKYLLEDLVQFLDQALGLVSTNQNSGRLLDLAKKVNMKQAENDLMAKVNNYLQKASWTDMQTFFKDNMC